MRNPGGGLSSPKEARPRQTEELLSHVAQGVGLCMWICVPECQLTVILSKGAGWSLFVFKTRFLSASESCFRYGLTILATGHSWREVVLFPSFQVQRGSLKKWFMSPLQCHTSSVSFWYNLFREEMKQSGGYYVQKYINILIWLEI